MLEAFRDGSAVLMGFYLNGYEDGRYAYYGNRDFAFDPYEALEEGQEDEAEPEELPQEEALQEEWSEAELVEQAASVDPSASGDPAQEQAASRKTQKALTAFLSGVKDRPVTAETDFLNLRVDFFDGDSYQAVDLFVAADRQELPAELAENIAEEMNAEGSVG